MITWLKMYVQDIVLTSTAGLSPHTHTQAKELRDKYMEKPEAQARAAVEGLVACKQAIETAKLEVKTHNTCLVSVLSLIPRLLVGGEKSLGRRLASLIPSPLHNSLGMKLLYCVKCACVGMCVHVCIPHPSSRCPAAHGGSPSWNGSRAQHTHRRCWKPLIRNFPTTKTSAPLSLKSGRPRPHFISNSFSI